MLRGMGSRVLRWLFGRDLAVWHAPEYRLPLSGVEARTGFDTRRAEHALWSLVERHAIARSNLRAPRRAEELARVHTAELLDSLGRAETLARIWSIDPSDVPVDEVMTSIRLACGATIDAARALLKPATRQAGRRALNLLGGFHHASRDAAGALRPPKDRAAAPAGGAAPGRSRPGAADRSRARPPHG